MDKNCFYYSFFTPEGNRCLCDKNEFSADKNIALVGDCFSVKQFVFNLIKSELEKAKISYTDFCCANGSAGIFCAEKNFKIIDGNLFNNSDKNYEKILLKNHQIINVENEFFELNFLKNKIEKEYNRAQRFLRVCSLVNEDASRLKLKYLNSKKINQFTLSIWQKQTDGLKGKIGTQSRKYVTCITGDGVELNMSAFDKYCSKMLIIKDSVGDYSGIIVDRIRRYAIGSGYDVIMCPCTLNKNRTEHLIIPELKFGIFTSKHYHRDDFQNARTVYANRFAVRKIDEISNRIEYSLSTYKSLMSEAIISIKNAEEIQKEIDEISSENINKYSLAEDVYSCVLK